MLALALSTIAFFVSGYLIKRKLEDMDIPAGLTRKLLVFSLALAVSYGVALLVDKLFP
jgi:hypothetical protein